MCGIVGVMKKDSNPVSKKEFSDFIKMLILCEKRGTHATGVIIVKSSGRIICIKTGARATEVASYIPFLKDAVAYLGHTRYSTGGKPEVNINNHPHYNDRWALIHNGVVNTPYTRKELKIQSDCDTEEIVQTFSLIEKRHKIKHDDYQKLFKAAFKQISGSWALSFVDKMNRNMFLTTNGRNPLKVVYFDEGLAFASVVDFMAQTSFYERGRILTEDEKSITEETTVQTTYIQQAQAVKEFTPKPDDLFIFNRETGLLEKVCSYTFSGKNTEFSRRAFLSNRSYFNDTCYGLGDDEPGYENIGHPPPLFAGQSNKAPIKNTFTVMDAYWQNHFPIFDLYQGRMLTEVRDRYSDTVLREYGKWLLAENIEIFAPGLPTSKSVSDINIMLNNLKNAKPPRELLDVVNSEFETVFLSELGKLIHKNAFEEFVKKHPLRMNIVTPNVTIEPTILRTIPWYTRVIVCIYGIDFGYLSSERYENGLQKCFVFNKNGEPIEIKRAERVNISLSTFDNKPNSILKCKACSVTRVVVKVHAEGEDFRELHCCPKCKDVARIIRPKERTN